MIPNQLNLENYHIHLSINVYDCFVSKQEEAQLALYTAQQPPLAGPAEESKNKRLSSLTAYVIGSRHLTLPLARPVQDIGE